MSNDGKKEQLRKLVAEKSLLRGESFMLASGVSSNYYFNMKAAIFDPEGATLIADLVLDAVQNFDIKNIGGLEMGAVPIAACVSMRSFQRQRPLPGFLVRKETRAHGTQARIEPPLPPGTRVAVVEDVTTTGASALQAAKVVVEAGCKVAVVVTIVDRLEGATAAFAKQNLPFVALLRSDEFSLAE